MHPVAQLIQRRLRGETDPHRLAIVAEDGGMRWVVTGGMMAYLQGHHFMPEIIGGTSGGAISGLFYAAGQTALGPEAISATSRLGFSKRQFGTFLSPFNLLRGLPIMNIDYLIDEEFTHVTGLNWQALINARTTVFVTTTSIETGSQHWVLNNTDLKTAQAYAKATARIPVLCKPNPKFPHWDGVFTQSIPLKAAFELGATHVLVLRSFASTEDQFMPCWSERNLLYPLLKRSYPSLLPLFQQRFVNKRAILQQCEVDNRVMVISPPPLNLGCLEPNPRKMLIAALAGWHSIANALSLGPKPFPRSWQKPLARYGLAQGAFFA